MVDEVIARALLRPLGLSRPARALPWRQRQSGSRPQVIVRLGGRARTVCAGALMRVVAPPRRARAACGRRAEPACAPARGRRGCRRADRRAGLVGGLERRPAQRRRALAGEPARGALGVRLRDGDVEAGVADRLARAREPRGVAELGQERDRGQRADAVVRCAAGPDRRRSRPGAAIVLLGVVGIGNALIDVGGFTLLARLADELSSRECSRGSRRSSRSGSRPVAC
jgi:hypothetical protein